MWYAALRFLEGADNNILSDILVLLQVLLQAPSLMAHRYTRLLIAAVRHLEVLLRIFKFVLFLYRTTPHICYGGGIL
jgi:hypothetical protein